MLAGIVGISTDIAPEEATNSFVAESPHQTCEFEVRAHAAQALKLSCNRGVACGLDSFFIHEGAIEMGNEFCIVSWDLA